MQMTIFARRLAKTVLFIGLFCLFARLIDASTFISLDAANKFARWAYGNANQDNYDNIWFFTDVILSLIGAVAGYIIIIRVINKLRS